MKTMLCALGLVLLAACGGAPEGPAPEPAPAVTNTDRSRHWAASRCSSSSLRTGVAAVPVPVIARLADDDLPVTALAIEKPCRNHPAKAPQSGFWTLALL